MEIHTEGCTKVALSGPSVWEAEGRTDMAKVHFTKSFIETVEPGEKRLTFTDDKSRGLTLLVTPKGVKTFYLTRKFRNRVERTLLGHYPELSLVEAKSKAARFQVQYDAGINPNEAKRRARAEPTLDELFEIYYQDHCLIRNRRPEGVRNNYRCYLTRPLGHRKISTITRTEIKDLMRKHSDHGQKRTGNIMHGLIRAMFNKAIAWEYMEGPNPAIHIERYPEKSRDRFLSAEELVRFHKALLKEPDETIRDCIYTLLLTGVRRSNAFTMQWSHVDFDQAVWRIPDTKNGSPHRVVLSPEMMEILKRRRKTARSLFVFPGSGQTGHLVDIKRAWMRLLDRAGIEDLRVHDLRRTFGSWMLADGQSLSVIGKALGHKDIQSTMVYARLSVEQLRAPVNSISSRLMSHKTS